MKTALTIALLLIASVAQGQAPLAPSPLLRPHTPMGSDIHDTRTWTPPRGVTPPQTVIIIQQNHRQCAPNFYRDRVRYRRQWRQTKRLRLRRRQSLRRLRRFFN